MLVLGEPLPPQGVLGVHEIFDLRKHPYANIPQIMALLSRTIIASASTFCTSDINRVTHCATLLNAVFNVFNNLTHVARPDQASRRHNLVARTLAFFSRRRSLGLQGVPLRRRRHRRDRYLGGSMNLLQRVKWIPLDGHHQS